MEFNSEQGTTEYKKNIRNDYHGVKVGMSRKGLISEENSRGNTTQSL